MKVLQINTVFGRGSTGRIVADIHNLLPKRGHIGKVVYGRYKAPENIDAVKIGSKVATIYHVFQTRIFDRQGFASKKATKQLIAVIEEYQPDIIHLHNLHGYYLNVKLLFNYLAKKDTPIVWTFHDCWPYTGHCVHFDYIGCKKWKTKCFACPKKKEYPNSFLFDNSRKNYRQKKALFTLPNNVTVVTVSDWLKGQVEQSFMSKYNVVRIYNGIDRKVFQPTESNLKERLGITDKFMMLGVSDTWSERKGLSYFMKLSQELKEDEALVMVGFKKEELAGLPKNIIALGRTDSEQQLVEFYSAADVVLNPSFEETFGLVTAEALSCGTPVIVSNTTASPELVDETCGRVVKKNDYEGFKRAIAEIKASPIEKEVCLKRAELFDKEKNYQLYIDLYEKIVGVSKLEELL